MMACHERRLIIQKLGQFVLYFNTEPRRVAPHRNGTWTNRSSASVSPVAVNAVPETQRDTTNLPKTLISELVAVISAITNFFVTFYCCCFVSFRRVVFCSCRFHLFCLITSGSRKTFVCGKSNGIVPAVVLSPFFCFVQFIEAKLWWRFSLFLFFRKCN